MASQNQVLAVQFVDVDLFGPHLPQGVGIAEAQVLRPVDGVAVQRLVREGQIGIRSEDLAHRRVVLVGHGGEVHDAQDGESDDAVPVGFGDERGSLHPTRQQLAVIRVLSDAEDPHVVVEGRGDLGLGQVVRDLEGPRDGVPRLQPRLEGIGVEDQHVVIGGPDRELVDAGFIQPRQRQVSILVQGVLRRVDGERVARRHRLRLGAGERGRRRLPNLAGVLVSAERPGLGGVLSRTSVGAAPVVTLDRGLPTPLGREPDHRRPRHPHQQRGQGQPPERRSLRSRGGCRLPGLVGWAESHWARVWRRARQRLLIGVPQRTAEWLLPAVGSWSWVEGASRLRSVQPVGRRTDVQPVTAHHAEVLPRLHRLATARAPGCVLLGATLGRPAMDAESGPAVQGSSAVNARFHLDCLSAASPRSSIRPRQRKCDGLQGAALQAPCKKLG